MNAILDHVAHDLQIINEERKTKNLYQHGFAKSFIDPQPNLHYLEFNDFSNNQHPAFIISINKDPEKMDITLFKGECQRDNVFSNKKITEVRNFGRYARDSLGEALDMYYAEICRIMDA